MRIFIIVRRQPERFSQGVPGYDHGDGTQKEERRFWGSLDHRVAGDSGESARDRARNCLRPFYAKGSGQDCCCVLVFAFRRSHSDFLTCADRSYFCILTFDF